MKTSSVLAPLAATAALTLFVIGSGCTPNLGTVPKGPQDTKTGYSVTYRLNGRTENGELEAAGKIPTAGAEIFRAEPKAEKKAE